MSDQALLTHEISGDERAELAAVAQRFAGDEVRPLALELDIGDPEAVGRCWAGIAEIGFDRCIGGEGVGGGELPLGALMAVLDQLGSADAGVAMLTLLSNCAALAGRAGDGTGRWAYVPLPGDGRASSPAFDGERVTGRLDIAFGASGADGYVVECLSGGSTVLVAVAGDAGGVTCRPSDDALGLGGSLPGSLEFINAAGESIGDASRAELCACALRAGVAAIAHGTARHAREKALEYAHSRIQGGVAISERGAVREMLARIAEREQSRADAATGAAGGPADLNAAIALNTAVTDDAVTSTIDAVQVFGGMGYMRETGVEKLMRDAKYCQLYPVSNWLERDRLV